MSIGSTPAKNIYLAGTYGDNKGSGAPSTTTFRLFIGDPTAAGVEVSGGAYAGVAVANTTTNMGTPAGGALGPINVTFPTATANWGTPNYWANTDGTGNIYDYGPITAPSAIDTGQVATLAVTLQAA